MKTPEEINKGLEHCAGFEPCIYCPYSELSDFQYTCETELFKDALAYIKQLEANQPKWISVFDVIPEKFKDVLACDKNGNFGIVQFFDDNEPYEMRECGWTEVEVYYWMPLPEPPKED